MSIRLICASHTPLMDHIEADGATESNVRSHFRKLAREVSDYDPEVVVIFAPDHFKGFFYDVLPSFTIGVRAVAIGDYGIGSGSLDVPESLALQCLEACRQADVDPAISYRMRVDHGFAQLLVLLGGRVDRWPCIPIHINCAGSPLPGFRRVRRLGEAVGKWARQLEKRVLLLGSGGLSHDPPIPNLRTASPAVADKLIDNRNASPQELLAREQANFEVARRLMRGEGNALPLNPEWDLSFMQNMAAGRLEVLDSLAEDSLASLAGCGGHEVRTWVAAYAALGACGPYQAENIFYQDIAAWNAGMGIAAARPQENPRS